MNFGFGMTLGIFPVVAFLAVIVFWGLIIAALVLGIRWLIRADQRSRYSPTPPTDTPLEVLRQRYARGEIDEEEYERRRRTLTGS
jgi:Predicted membrane protein